MRSRQTWEDLTLELSRQKQQPRANSLGQEHAFQVSRSRKKRCLDAAKGTRGRVAGEVERCQITSGHGKRFGFHSVSMGSHHRCRRDYLLSLISILPFLLVLKTFYQPMPTQLEGTSSSCLWTNTLPCN